MTDTAEISNNSIMTVRYKMVFVGDVYTGKTSIMNRFISQEFSDQYDVTQNYLIITEIF